MKRYVLGVSWWLGFASVGLAFGGCASGGTTPRGTRDGGVSPSDGSVEDASSDARIDASRDAMMPTGDCDGERDGTPCDADDDGCTMDLCRSGVCVVEGEADCDDGVSCTVDMCRSTGSLTFTCDRDVVEGCFIDGACVAAGATNPTATCQSCNPSMPSAWTESTGACDDGDACTEGDTCTGGDCVGTPILDDYEPNETVGAAHSLGSVGDGADFPRGTILGTFYPVGDVDWYRYRDNDELFGSIFPRSELVDIPAGLNFDLCLFVTCVDGSAASVTCRNGSAASFEGRSGCCSRNAGNASENVRIDHTCEGSGTDDSVDVYARVENMGGAATCEQSYRLRWGDD